MSSLAKKQILGAHLLSRTISSADLATRMTAIVESAEDAIIGKDPDGTIVIWNAAAARLFGYETAEIVGRSVLLIIPPELHELELEMMKRLRQGEHVDAFDTQRIRKNGERVDVSLSMSAIRDPAGQILGISTIAREISDRTRLQEARFRLAAIVESSDDAIISKDLNGIITSWNAAATRILGYQPHEIIGRSVLTIIPPELHDEEPDILARLRAGERIEHYETTRCGKGGRRLHVSLTISPVRDANGRVVGASKILRDITERQRLDEARSRLAAIVESSDDAIISKDLNGIINSWNEGAKRMFGYEAEEIVGRSVLTLIPPELQHEEPVILSKLRAGERIEHYETRRVTKHGRLLDVSLTISPVKDTHGRVIGASKIARDITEKKMAEAALIERERLAATGRLAATLAHEVNNPLESIMNLAFLLVHDSSLSTQAHGYADLLLREVQRASEITRQTLSFYRSSKIPGEVHVADMLEAVVASKSKKLEEKGISVENDFRDDLDYVLGFAGELRQVFDNLIENAIDAVPHGGKIRVRARTSHCDGAKKACITVCDNGPGIPRAIVDRIFEPFFTTKQHKGSGLGLWVTRAIVQKHGGNIRVRTRQTSGNSGTVFRVILPRDTFESARQ